MISFFRTEDGDILDLYKIITIERWGKCYRIFFTGNIYIDISVEDYARINNYIATWDKSVYFKTV